MGACQLLCGLAISTRQASGKQAFNSSPLPHGYQWLNVAVTNVQNLTNGQGALKPKSLNSFLGLSLPAAPCLGVPALGTGELTLF